MSVLFLRLLNLSFHFLYILLYLHVKDQNKHMDGHRETDDMSEKTSPNKNLKSPQKGSKRLKTAPFKVTLLDSSEFEGETEVRQTENNLHLHVFWN